MTDTNVFTIYNASAGSGKTYTLVKSYISTLLKSTDPNKFRHLLAITFTNKAVAEMKSRIIHTLSEFSNYIENDGTSVMLEQLSSELQLSAEQIAQKSSIVLDRLLQNYAAFDVLTIDTLTHRILRTFSKDLELSGNFEVSLDVKDIHSEAVDALIDKTGSTAEITEVLVDFALQKTEEDKSWDIAYDLTAIAKLLQSENDRIAVLEMSQKTLTDFKALKSNIDRKLISLKAKIKKQASKLLLLLEEHSLEKSHFVRGSFYNHILKLIQQPDGIKFTAKWQDNFEEQDLYTKTQKQEVKDSIDALRDQFNAFFNTTKLWVCDLKFHKALLRKITPLSVLHLIHQEIQELKEGQNIMLISDFNDHIFKYLKDQPAPFIYERLGERYSNYFIDEFQDTSILQWENLVPLIDNALSSASGDTVSNGLLLVGDPKQAIYRWRGGQAEQFISLWHKNHPFSITQIETTSLETNYRSATEIIGFNNRFFKHLSTHIDNSLYKDIYEENTFQKHTDKNGGLVSLSFITAQTVADCDTIYPEKVYEIIKLALQDGFQHKDICILTRANKQGAHIAQYLTEKKIPVTSPDNLILSNSEDVRFICAIMRLLAFPNTPEFTITVLECIHERLGLEDAHHYYATWVHENTITYFKSLESHNILFDPKAFERLPFYEAVEYLIGAFQINKQADTYILAFLDCVHSYTLKHHTGLWGFLSFWDQKQDSLNVDVDDHLDAVQVMSIHKAKGLEFPVVIFPYADTPLYASREEYYWYTVNADTYQGFSQLMIDHNIDVAQYGEQGEELYHHRKQQQQFDSINLLYVALTRPVERLYIIGRFRESKSTPNAFNEFFIDFLKTEEIWEGPEKEYVFGVRDAPYSSNTKAIKTQDILCISTPREKLNLQIATTAAFLWDQKRQEAIIYGNMLHELLSKIVDRSDYTHIINDAIEQGLVAKHLKNQISHCITSIIHHPKLAAFFDNTHQIYNERPILSQKNKILIPDRIEITAKKEIYLLDYKTGSYAESHKTQIHEYAMALTQMNFEVVQNYLVYITNDGMIEVV